MCPDLGQFRTNKFLDIPFTLELSLELQNK